MNCPDKPYDQKLKLLSIQDLDELIEFLGEMIVSQFELAAVAICMWDPDMEMFDDKDVFGPEKRDFRKFVDKYLDSFEESNGKFEEIEPSDYGSKLSSQLDKVLSYPVNHDEGLCALVLLSGAGEDSIEEIRSYLDDLPLGQALANSWDYMELKRENERLRSRYEELEDRNVYMEEQTRKLIHDFQAKDVLKNQKLENDKALFEISNSVRSSLKLKEVLQRSVNSLGQHFKFTHCYLLRPVDTAEHVDVFEYCAEDATSVKECFLTDDGLNFVEVAMTKSAPQVLIEPELDPQTSYDPAFLGRLGYRSGVTIPLKVADRILGVVFLQEHKISRELTIDSVSFLQALADLIAVGIENADLHEEQERKAVTDGLTGVANRRHFNEVFLSEFERARRYEQPLSLVVVDLDYLKKINDSHGHQAGDEAIKEIARVMQESSRSIDLTARYGGEEFCLLLPNTELEMAVQTAERLRGLINTCVIEGPGNISASIGVASFPRHGDDPDSLFQLADEALYEAKEKGRNRVCVASSPSPAC